jgi:hypothetical protein
LGLLLCPERQGLLLSADCFFWGVSGVKAR